MTAAEFDFLRAFLRRRSGLDLGADKRYLVESRLRPLARQADLPSVGALVAELRRDPSGDTAGRAVAAMATHETSFFRDRSAYDQLRDVVLPRLLAQRAETRRLRIWSAAASTGQEAYSVGMLLLEMRPRLTAWQLGILGTDLSDQAVARARAGCFSQLEVQRGLPIMKLLCHFRQDPEGWRASDELRRLAEFRVFNLLDDFAHLGRFDLILCRNLLIYLDAPTRASLLERLGTALAAGGLLCLGASETVLGCSEAFVPDPEARSFLRLASHASKPAAEVRQAG